jgi:hypothetical protein
MADFEQLRQQLAAHSAERASLARQALAAAEQVKKTEQRLRAFDRRARPDDQAARGERERLLGLQRAQHAHVERLRETIARADAVLGGVWREFLPFTDPRANVRLLDDRTPILLLPLRLETRFQQVQGDAGTSHQLCVRVYPDECSIDTFDPLLSDVEALNTRRYWAAAWSAGGDETAERTAWRMLVGSHGAGRAGYLIRAYTPIHAAPQKASPHDVILVIVDAEGLPAAERSAAADFWRAVWLADGDAALTDQAWQALVTAVGAERADVLRRDFRPQNLAERPVPPFGKPDVQLQVVVARFPTEDEFPTKRFAWSTPARARLLPERLVLLAYRGGQVMHEIVGNPIAGDVIVGPDPQDAAQFTKADGDLVWGSSIRWMVDFAEAVDKGLGFRIALSVDEATLGFDRLIVVGVRTGASPSRAAAELEDLLHNHLRSRSGLSLLPQGTPTNNTESNDSFYRRTDDPDDSFDVFVRDARQFEQEPDEDERRDGEWLARWLGIGTAVLQRTPHAGQTDQREARAMNVALWPATLGYFFETMLQPVLDDEDIEFVRAFFTRYVSGRGPVPAVRVGRQPYGILPATAFHRQEWMARTGDDVIGVHVPLGSRLQRLYEILARIEEEWKTFLPRVSFVGNTGPDLDAHQMLLDILGLHPSSEDHHYRYAHSLEYLQNHFRLLGFGSQFEAALAAFVYKLGAIQLLGHLGHAGTQSPDLLDRFFFSRQQPLSRFLIDDLPLSETAPVRSYTTDPANPGDPAGRNYLRWLREAATTSVETVRMQQGFWDNKPPEVLLYVLLRHALLTGYHETGLRLLGTHGVFQPAVLRGLKRESPFISIAEAPSRPESRFEMLYQQLPWEPQATRTLAEHITLHLGAVADTSHLAAQIAAIARLEDVPTARLERLLVEHLDCCSYRLDAWRLGLLHVQLALMRARANTKPGEAAGIHVGAYGWLENVRPENRVLTPVELTDEQEAFFLKHDPTPPMRDARNDGHILAPSLNQAVTAAILRNGYRANVVPGQPDVLAVDLSSERVRLALGIIEGMRAGQKLGALLGYRFERALHDRTDGLELDRFVLPFRTAFPLVARKLKATAPPDGTPIEAVEARNVLDGLEFVKHVRGNGPKTYPYGKSQHLPGDATAAERAAIDAEVARLVALQDAVADLALAESVHQVVMGNHERTAANLDSYAGAGTPPEPDVVRTPRSGTTLTHRLAIHLDPQAAAAPGAGPRSTAEPALQRWLSDVLPLPADIACVVGYHVRNAPAPTSDSITAADLQLEALDLLYHYGADRAQAATTLDDRIVAHIVASQDLHPGSAITMTYTEPVPGKKTLWEVNPLLESLGHLLLGGRALQATDVAPPADTTSDVKSEPSLDPMRIQTVRDRLDGFNTTLVKPLEADLQSRFDADPVQEDHLVQHIDDYVADVAALTNEAGGFGLLHAGVADTWSTRQQIFSRLLERLAAYTRKWKDKLDEFDALIAQYPATPADEQLELLLRAERTISTSSTDPATVADTDVFESTLQTVTRAAFSARLSQLDGLVVANGQALAAFLAAAEAFDNTAFDAEALDFADEKPEIVRLTEEMLGRTRALRRAIDARLAAADRHWADHVAATDGAASVTALEAAARALLGEDFRVFPSFTPRVDQANEWANAWNARAALLAHAGTETPFPADDWLYGVARVHEKVRHYENVLMLAAAFERPAPELTPLQLPFVPPPDYHWLAMAFPPGAVPDVDVLLYTAHYPAPFNAAARQCGVLLDEWTETVPTAKETTGLSFHFDRPNSEAPQAWLLVTPAAFTGGWRWNDVVDALHDTLALARLRAIEPAFLDGTRYAPFLPATISAAAGREVSIVANLAIAAHVTQIIPTT